MSASKLTWRVAFGWDFYDESSHVLIEVLSPVANVPLFRVRHVLERTMRIDETQRISCTGHSVGIRKPKVLVCIARLERGEIRVVMVATGHLRQRLPSVPSVIAPNTYEGGSHQLFVSHA